MSDSTKASKAFSDTRTSLNVHAKLGLKGVMWSHYYTVAFKIKMKDLNLNVLFRYRVCMFVFAWSCTTTNSRPRVIHLRVPPAINKLFCNNELVQLHI